MQQIVQIQVKALGHSEVVATRENVTLGKLAFIGKFFMFDDYFDISICLVGYWVLWGVVLVWIVLRAIAGAHTVENFR